jgi:hypothetical protein
MGSSGDRGHDCRPGQNYRDFQRLVAASDRVFYFFDKKDSCFLYGVSGILKDWVTTTNLTDDDGNAPVNKLRQCC